MLLELNEAMLILTFYLIAWCNDVMTWDVMIPVDSMISLEGVFNNLVLSR
ncbi:MAG: hypothetical protein ACI9WC_001727 [Arenicella sp.]|jgi:hypothetical protein